MSNKFLEGRQPDAYSDYLARLEEYRNESVGLQPKLQSLYWTLKNFLQSSGQCGFPTWADGEILRILLEIDELRERQGNETVPSPQEREANDVPRPTLGLLEFSTEDIKLLSHHPEMKNFEPEAIQTAVGLFTITEHPNSGPITVRRGGISSRLFLFNPQGELVVKSSDPAVFVTGLTTAERNSDIYQLRVAAVNFGILGDAIETGRVRPPSRNSLPEAIRQGLKYLL